MTALFHLVRELVLLAAAAGIAWWCWDAYMTRSSRRDSASRSELSAERAAADARLQAERIETHLAHIASRIDELAARGAEAERLAADKVRVHALLQATSDPFLSFDEIEQALAGPPAAAPAPDGQHAAPPLAGDRLRRVLIEMLRDGAVAQMDRDRYFIASEYETGEDAGETVSQT